MTGDQGSPVTLTLKGKEFRVVKPPTWATMRLMAAYTSGDDGRAFGAMYDFLSHLVDPADWSAFQAHASTADVEFTDLDSAIGDAMASLAGRGKGSEGSSTPSSGGSQTPETPPTSRVVSLSKGTVEENPVHPSWGGQESSTA
jgi:hypothetical protein